MSNNDADTDGSARGPAGGPTSSQGPMVGEMPTRPPVRPRSGLGPAMAPGLSSIWAQPPVREQSGSDLLGGVPAPGLRRARAGTLPSRLPTLKTSGEPPALGSLALMSPEGDNDVLWDPPMGAPPGSGPGSLPKSGLGPLLDPRIQQRTRSGSLNSVGYSPFPSIWNRQSPPSTTPPDSLPGAAEFTRRTSPPNRDLARDLARDLTRDITRDPARDTTRDSVRDATEDSKPEDDPMHMFSAELQKRADPHRMRSYTLTGPSMVGWPVPPVPTVSHAAQSQVPPVSGVASGSGAGSTVSGASAAHSGVSHGHLPAMAMNLGRPRAHTLVSAPLTTPQISLAPFGKQPQLLHERTPDGHTVVLGDVSSVPTPALWLANVPPNTTTYALHALYGAYGRVESARVLPAGQGAVVMFASTAGAIDAHAATNGAELWPGGGPTTVAFATVLDTAPPVAYTLQALDASPLEISQGLAHTRRASQRVFDRPLPTSPGNGVSQNGGDRVYGAGVLRELRRRLEGMSAAEMDELALDLQAELPALAPDYIGNTVVQQVFERVSPHVRDMMLRRLMGVLASTGTHKNGTWAAQKIIDLVNTPRQYSMVEQALRPHLVALLLDQFGNYVVQGCLKFGSPWNDWIFGGLATLLAQVAHSRFGARAVRAILEAPHTSVAQQRLVAAAIAQDAANLASNPNGNLLVGWLLDSFTSGGPGRFSLVTAQLMPQLAEMCTSKVAGTTVLKLVVHGPSGVARRVLEALLDPATDSVPVALEQVLRDPTGNGAMFLYRLLTTALSEGSLEKQVAINKIRMALLQPYAQVPPNKRLLEEVGLTVLAGDRQ